MFAVFQITLYLCWLILRGRHIWGLFLQYKLLTNCLLDKHVEPGTNCHFPDGLSAKNKLHLDVNLKRGVFQF